MNNKDVEGATCLQCFVARVAIVCNDKASSNRIISSELFLASSSMSLINENLSLRVIKNSTSSTMDTHCHRGAAEDTLYNAMYR